MTSQEKKNQKLQEKINKLSAKQSTPVNAVSDDIRKNNEALPELPVYSDIMQPSSAIDEIPAQGEVYAVTINSGNEKESSKIAKNKGFNMVPENHTASVDRLLYEGEKDYLSEPKETMQQKKNNTDFISSLFGSKGNNTRKKTTVKIPKTAQDSIPYEYVYKNGIIETEPGIFSKSYILNDVNFKTATDEEQENMFINYGSFLNMFDSETRVEVTVFNRNINRDQFKEKTLLKLKNDGLDKYRVENNAILESKMNEGKNNIFHEKYITVSIPADSIESAVKRFQSIDTDISAHLKRIINTETYPMTIEERLAVLHEMYNPGSDLPLDSKGVINGKTVQTFSLDGLKAQGLSSKDAIAPPYIEFDMNYIVIGDKYCRVMFIDNLPSFLSTDFITELTDISCNMITSIHYEPLRQDKTMKIIRNQIVNIDSNVIDAQKKATRSGYSPDLISHDLRKAQEEANRIMSDITSRNQKMFLTTLVLAVYADSLEELDKYTSSIQTTASKFLCSLKVLKYQQEAGLTTVLPLASNKLYVQRLLTTEASSVFIPFSAQELSQDNGMYYGLNAVSRNLILFNRINSKNANGVILGTPGSGKSFSAKREIINVILGTNDDIYIIDPEREYAPLAALFNGEVVRIAAGSKTYVNPLDMDLEYADDDDPITLKSDFLGSICETVLGGKFGLSPVQRTVIDRCVRQVYRPYMEQLRLSESKLTCDKTIMPTLDDFYQCLLSQPEPEAQQIALALEMYCRGSFDTFAHRSNVNTNARFVVYDIKDIGSTMKELGLLVCLNDIWNKIIENKKKGKRTWFYIDEFYLLTQNDSSARFLQQVYKRARKWGGVPTGITQNVEDLLSSKEARGIINNCDFIMMLNQSPLDRAELGAMLNISPAQMSYITNSDAGQGLLYTGKFIVPFIDKFPAGNVLYQAMTTKPEDVNLEEVTIKSDDEK